MVSCGGDSTDTESTPVAVTSATLATTPATVAPVTAPETTSRRGPAETPAPQTSPAPSAAPCTPEAILPIVNALDAVSTLEIVAVDIRECQNGYARVFAHPDQPTCGQAGGSCYDDEQVFLRDDGGSWVYLTSGTGIACTDPDLRPPELETACVALGMR